MSELVRIIPAVALRGIAVLPKMVAHFDISRDKSIKAVEQAMVGDQTIFLVAQKDMEVNDPKMKDLYSIGTIAVIKQVVKLPQNIIRVLVEGKERAELLSIISNDVFIEGEVAIFEDEDIEEKDEVTNQALLRNLKELFIHYNRENPKLPKDLVGQILEANDIQTLMEGISVNIPLELAEKQQFLETIDFMSRYETLSQILNKETEILRVQKEIQRKVKERVDQNQREYLLREQLKYIQEELGEDNVSSDTEQFLKELKKLKASKEVKDKLKKEIERFKSLSNNSAESGVVRGYIETLLELPWEKESKDNKDLKNAKNILDAEHYGLVKVKERILEYLAVRLLTNKGESPILCLVGPPGTGKTSIAKSVAHALNKKYVRISLGGVRDEAEIRGHRRTYIGAMPGRIVNGMKQAGVKNPLILLDEIDKMSRDYKGDTASALLEVLDSEQNKIFRDHYIELPMDLSEVLFIATANSIQSISKPLLDRMEIIEVSSYTENEKRHIGEQYLIPKQIERNGLQSHQISISKNALEDMIHHYTKEAGVRNLERRIGQICRKAAREIIQEDKKSIRITGRNLNKYLGKELYNYAKVNTENQVGIVRGLAWTSVGGDTLEIEVNILAGKGDFVLTGQMGAVMKESARTGISYIRSISEEYHIPDDFFVKHDIHIHIPEGAVPKDGPSAGITMATAMLSAITDIPVYANLAMTGEITLRGRVLPIGGLKEKLLAAKQAGITKVIVPSQNKVDVEDISLEITKGLEFIYAETMKDVLPTALVTNQ
ncbi:MAG TPA: endopeptidase La [Candidatus Merdenecus merdavium]|nr:endopeptidase La [Candidatus Merdenecus merdavium]